MASIHRSAKGVGLLDCCRWLLRETTVSSPSALFPLWASPLFPFSQKVSGCRPAVGGCYAKPPSAALQPLFPYGLPLCFWLQPTRSLKLARESGVAYRLRLFCRLPLTDAPATVSRQSLRLREVSLRLCFARCVSTTFRHIWLHVRLV